MKLQSTICELTESLLENVKNLSNRAVELMLNLLELDKEVESNPK